MVLGSLAGGPHGINYQIRGPDQQLFRLAFGQTFRFMLMHRALPTSEHCSTACQQRASSKRMVLLQVPLHDAAVTLASKNSIRAKVVGSGVQLMKKLASPQPMHTIVTAYRCGQV
jgi:hypothetical protein